MQKKRKLKREKIMNIIIILMVIVAMVVGVFGFFFKKEYDLKKSSDKLNFILNRQYLTIDNNLTELYYSLENPENGIFLNKNGINEKIANIQEDKIYLLKLYLMNGNINPEAYFFQRQRFYLDTPLDKIISQLQAIHNATLLKKGIVESPKNRINILPSWPENSVGYKEISIEETDIENYKNKLKINFFNTSQKNNKFDFLYLENQENYIELKGYTKRWIFPFNFFQKDYSNLAKFNSDNSVWIDSKLLEVIEPQLTNVKEGEYELEYFSIKSRNYGLLLWETNLKIKNYKELRKKINEFYK